MTTQANIRVDVSIRSAVRLEGEPFRPTRTDVAPFQYVTTTTTYLVGTVKMGTDIYNYVSSHPEAYPEDTTVYFNLTLDNVTAPTVSAGFIPMQKARINFAMSGDEVTSSQVVTDNINTYISDQMQRASYN